MKPRLYRAELQLRPDSCPKWVLRCHRHLWEHSPGESPASEAFVRQGPNMPVAAKGLSAGMTLPLVQLRTERSSGAGSSFVPAPLEEQFSAWGYPLCPHTRMAFQC